MYIGVWLHFCTIRHIPTWTQGDWYTNPYSNKLDHDREAKTVQRGASGAISKPFHGSWVLMGFIWNELSCTMIWVTKASAGSEASSQEDTRVRLRNCGWSWPKLRASPMALTSHHRWWGLPQGDWVGVPWVSWKGLHTTHCGPWFSEWQPSAGPSSFCEASHRRRDSTSTWKTQARIDGNAFQIRLPIFWRKIREVGGIS